MGKTLVMPLRFERRTYALEGRSLAFESRHHKCPFHWVNDHNHKTIGNYRNSRCVQQNPVQLTGEADKTRTVVRFYLNSILSSFISFTNQNPGETVNSGSPAGALDRFMGMRVPTPSNLSTEFFNHLNLKTIRHALGRVMAKRFTDTAKWDHSWFRKLSPKMKCAWFFLLDKCDGAGVWNVDLEALSFHVGEPISDLDLESFADKFRWISTDKILFTAFIDFQYGKLSEECKPHKPVIDRLKKLNLLEGYQKGFKTLEDKDKEKDKDQDQEKEKEKETREVSKSDLLELYAMYPRKEGKTKGLEKAKLQAKTRSTLEEIKTAISNYRKKIETQAIEPNYIKHFDTFMTTWRDSLDPETGSSLANPNQGRADLTKIFKEHA